MSTEAVGLELQAMRMELADMRRAARLQTQLGFTVKEAAEVTRIGETELRNRVAAPEHSRLHVKAVRIGRKIVIPRSECERLLAEQAR